MDKGWRMMHVFGWPFDTTQAVWNLIFGGVIDRYSSLKVITHHLGAMLPYFTRRIETNFNGFLKDKLPQQISQYWGNIYGDTALDSTMAAYPCGYVFFVPSGCSTAPIMLLGMKFGEDFIRDNLHGVKAMNISDEDKKKIE